MNPVIDANKLERGTVFGEEDKTVHWSGAFAAYGGHGATESSTIVYEIEPGNRLGWHTDAAEETQYILAGAGKLFMEDGSTHELSPGSVFVIPTNVRHDLANVGKETLRAVAFRRRDVYAEFRQRDAAAEDACVGDAESEWVSAIEISNWNYFGLGVTIKIMIRAYDEIVEFLAAGSTPSSVAHFEASQQTKEYVAELIRKGKSDGLNAEEASELDHFLKFEHVMRLAKARARTQTQQ